MSAPWNWLDQPWGILLAIGLGGMWLSLMLMFTTDARQRLARKCEEKR